MTGTPYDLLLHNINLELVYKELRYLLKKVAILSDLYIYVYPIHEYNTS